jgi:hypothetical protein
MRGRAVSAGLLSAALCLLGTALAPQARAGVDVDLGASIPVGDNGRLFFQISSRYFDMDLPVVEHWGVRYTNPDDLAVALFIAQRSGRSPDVVFALRRQGLSWWDVSLRTGIPVDAWFLPVEHDPGPPYGNAYGHWKKHRENPKHMVVLTDAEARHLVAARMGHEYYGVPVDEAMRWSASGHSVRYVIVREYDNRHGTKHAENDHDGDKDRGHTKGHSNGHGK